jgi:hypothetical protein
VRPGERPGLLDVRQVRQPVAQRGRHRDHRHVEPGEACGVRGRLVAALERGPQDLVGHVLDVGVAGGERRGPLLVDLEADDVEAGLARAHRHDQADVALPEHRHPGLATAQPVDQGRGHGTLRAVGRDRTRRC